MLVLGPVVFATIWAEFSDESLLFEERKRVLFSRKPFQLSKHSVGANVMKGLRTSLI